MGDEIQEPSLGQVFVPGGLPRVTYDPREALQLEDRVRDYLDERHKILSLSGPTKSGKTVLLKTVLPGTAIWISGGSVMTLDGFWDGVVDRLGLHTTEQAEVTRGETRTETEGMRADVGLPKVAAVGANESESDATSFTRKRITGRELSSARAALVELRRDPDRIVVVDDFHYIDQAVQLQIVRALKELVFDGLRVIFASVPHRAFDVVRVEKEMTGRVEQLQIDFWSETELRGIAEKGFTALNLEPEAPVLARLPKESFGSPHLMQEFCLHLCKANAFRVRQEVPSRLKAPADWADFFASRASAASKSAFDLLKQGPRQRADRKERVLVGGEKTDIYGAVLRAIAATGPKTQLPYTDLRSSLRDVLLSEPPQRHEVTRVLEEMTKIAREKIDGEPVVDYDVELETMYISDPFFAYFLRWGGSPD